MKGTWDPSIVLYLNNDDDDDDLWSIHVHLCFIKQATDPEKQFKCFNERFNIGIWHSLYRGGGQGRMLSPHLKMSPLLYNDGWLFNPLSTVAAQNTFALWCVQTTHPCSDQVEPVPNRGPYVVCPRVPLAGWPRHIHLSNVLVCLLFPPVGPVQVLLWSGAGVLELWVTQM